MIHDPSVFPIREIVDSVDTKLSHNNHLLYGHWLFELFRGKTWAALNFNWPQNLGIEDFFQRYH